MSYDPQSKIYNLKSTIPNSRVVAIIQARMGSSRLPGKVLLEIAGRPMLAWAVERCRKAKTLDEVVVATTTEQDDDPIEKLCAERGYTCRRGSLHDVLDRYYQAALASQAHVIVRITADCPLIDPQLIDHAIQAFLGMKPATGIDDPGLYRRLSPSNLELENWQASLAYPWDFVANRLPPPWGRTYPIGLDIEVCSFAALEIAWKEAHQTYHREHVMPYFYEHPERFRVLLVDHEQDYGTLRWTVDTAQDLELVRQICAHFPGQDDFSWLEVLALFENHPELAEINAGVQHKHYLQVDDRSNV